MGGQRDRAQLFGQITFAAIAVFVLGIIIGALLGSWAVFGVFAGLATLVFAANLLMLRDGDW